MIKNILNKRYIMKNLTHYSFATLIFHSEDSCSVCGAKENKVEVLSDNSVRVTFAQGNRAVNDLTFNKDFTSFVGTSNRGWEIEGKIDIGVNTILQRKIDEKDFKKKILIYQPFGLGDILFSMEIVESLKRKGFEIIWPIASVIDRSILKHFPKINFVSEASVRFSPARRECYETDEYIVLPLKWAREIEVAWVDYSTMRSKYDYMRMDLDSWKKLSWIRFKDVEEELMRKNNITKGEKYNFISQHFTSSSGRKVEIHPENGLRNVYMSRTAEFSMLDWASVIENATNIYIVGSSVNYMIEVLKDMKAENFYLYPRIPGPNHCNDYNYLFDIPYIEVL